MKTKTKFLWIEDNARTDLKHLLAPVYMSGRYDPVVASTVTEAVYQLKQTNFDAVVVDIRLLPGRDREWEELYTRLGRDKGAARLGLSLLYSLFGPRMDDVQIEDRPEWLKPGQIDPKRFGVLTVEGLEGDLREALESFHIDIDNYTQKTARTPHTTLLEMVDRITGAAKRRLER